MLPIFSVYFFQFFSPRDIEIQTGQYFLERGKE